MTVCVGSMWRDSTDYLCRALSQFDQLADRLEARGDRVEFVFAVGDSIDETDALLAAWHRKPRIVIRSDGCRYFGSVDDPARWRHLAWVQNGVLERIPDSADVFLWVESDLTWDAEDLVTLIDRTEEWPVAAAANMHPDGRWYDIHGTRVDGEHFSPAPPFHRSYDGLPMAVDSTGGCLAFRAAIARNTRCQPEDGYIGWCRDIRRLGFPLILDPALRVTHPTQVAR